MPDGYRRFRRASDAATAINSARSIGFDKCTSKPLAMACTRSSDRANAEAGFRYEVTAEGGADYIRSKVLRAVLEGEQEAITRGETERSSLGRANYTFQSDGIDDAGLANILVSPRRKERILVAGTMFLQPEDGRLVRLQRQLAKSPSFWIKNVDIVRSYDRIAGVVVPVALELTAQVQFLGPATLRMTYVYSEIDGRRHHCSRRNLEDARRRMKAQARSFYDSNHGLWILESTLMSSMKITRNIIIVQHERSPCILAEQDPVKQDFGK